MAITTGTNVPSSFRAGDTTSWTIGYTDYPASSWSLTYYFRRSGEETISLTATASGTDFAATLTAEDSAQFREGRWRWHARAELQGTGAIVAESGIVTVKPDPAQDPDKTFAENMLAKHKATALKRAGEPFNSSDLAGSSLDRKTDAEIAEAINYWQARVNRERARKESIESGGPRRNSRIWLRN